VYTDMDQYIHTNAYSHTSRSHVSCETQNPGKLGGRSIRTLTSTRSSNTGLVSSQKNILNIEPNRRDGRDNLSELKLVKDGGLTGGVQTDHENSNISLAHEGREKLRNRESHSEELVQKS
jgi:hypothetical protein